MLQTTIDFIFGLHPLILLAAGIVLLVKCADWLVDGSVALARIVGCSPLLIGLTIVAFGTSAPELAVNVAAAIDDKTGLSFGNVMGSNIANIGLVIGIGALFAPIEVHGRVVRKELPLLIFVSVVAAVLALWNRGFNRLDGAVMLAGFGTFMLIWYRLGQRDSRDPMVRDATDRAREQPGFGLAGAVVRFLIGLAGLCLGGKLTEHGAVELASSIGVSDTLIGLTVVAVATSLPEVFTVIAAARKGHADLATGNVIGSNVFNLLLVLAITALIAEVPVPEHGPQDLLAMVALTALFWVLAAGRTPIMNRIKGTILLTVYAGYMIWCVVR